MGLVTSQQAAQDTPIAAMADLNIVPRCNAYRVQIADEEIGANVIRPSVLRRLLHRRATRDTGTLR